MSLRDAILEFISYRYRAKRDNIAFGTNISRTAGAYRKKELFYHGK